MPKINKEEKKYIEMYDELFFIEKQLDTCKFIPNINRTAKLGSRNGSQKGLGFTNPVGLKLSYLNGNYELPRFDEVNGDSVYLNVCKFICKYYPDHKFNALTINKNFRCKKHTDNKNTGVSWIVGLGDYQGGDLNLYCDEEEKEHKYSWIAEDMKLNIRYRPTTFDGSQIPHDVDEWTGTRYSIVAYYL